MSQAIAGHGALIAIELDPTLQPGVFTTVAELNGDIKFPGLMRPETEVTTHQDDIDQWITGRLGRDAVSWSVNWIFDDETHDESTGMIALIAANTIFGIRMLGPGSSGAAGDDEIIASGQLTAVNNINHPVREGARTADVTMRLSKRMKVNGTFIGTNT